MQYFRIFLCIIFGVLPSLVWLFYYLRKDLHPEPKKMILKMFLLGCLITAPVFFIQVGLVKGLHQLAILPFLIIHPTVLEIIKWFLIIALSEELLKYVVVKLGVLGNSALDEPLDIMLYMVVVALGFAAVENVFYLFSPIDNISLSSMLQTTLIISVIRFVGATFLHTLCSALVGYFAALASLRNKKGLLLTVTGIVLAVLLHGWYDFAISSFSWPLGLIIPGTILIGLMIFIMYDFDEVKKIKSICKL